MNQPPEVICAHPGPFGAQADVSRIEDVGAFAVTLKIWCGSCGEPFQFLGMEMGLSSAGPMMSVSGLEANLPIQPASAKLPPSVNFGYRIHGTPAVEPAPSIVSARRGVRSS